MSVQHFKSLLFRSIRIKKEIDAETLRRKPDRLRLLKLKKLYLVIQGHLQRSLMQSPAPQL